MASSIITVSSGDIPDLLPLIRGYCDFYEVSPTDESLLELIGNMIENPGEGTQLIARDANGEPVGFATVYWTWQTLSAARTGVMNDLFVVPEARGMGWADALIESCGQLCRDRNITSLIWQTALDNERAQGVYARVGGKAERWMDWSLDVTESTGAQVPGA